jgi:DNA processing protein
VSYGRLVARFGTALGALTTSRERGGTERLVAATAGPDGGWPTLTTEAARAVAVAAGDPDRLRRRLASAGVRAIPIEDPAYPARLRAIDLPPPVLFVQGDPEALACGHAVAVVGTRRPTEDGRDVTARLAWAIAEAGAAVVSGLALGIDAAAHAAAVRARRRTVAVIGGGHAHLYPRANGPLARGILAQGGAIVSEFPPDVAPNRGTFPRRNRIISGLSDATVVVEAGARSGALTTAAWALEQGRGLYLVPGSIDSPSVAGCLAFLRELAPEARIVAGVAELLEDLGLAGGEQVRQPPTVGEAAGVTAPIGPSSDAILASLAPTERAVAREILGGVRSLDEIVHATGLPPAGALAAITVLELRGLIGGAFGRYQPVGVLEGADVARRPRPAARRRRPGPTAGAAPAA